MSFLPSLAAGQFALAGLVCAGLALAIHLFNRRRQHTVHWAAMDLLQQALRRKRRMIRLRDLLLLLLRIGAVLFFGLALAQPYWSSHGQPLDVTQPVHAVLLIDNSLSMAFETLEGTLLDRAKQRARRIIQSLPRGSRVSLIPVCGSRFDDFGEPILQLQRALELLERIDVVDRSTSFRQVTQTAHRAGQDAGELTRRVMFLTDRQRITWADLETGMADAPESLQIVDVSAASMENSWVADLRVQDAIADPETPATVLVRVKNRGTRSRKVQVTLTVDGHDVASEAVTLNPIDKRELAFSHIFPRPDHEGPPRFVPIKASMTPDLLSLDDERHLMVPVVATLPAVFVDQHGDREAPLAGRVGETRALRRLMAPVASAAAASLPRLRHRRIDQLTRPVLANTRLVVIAGVVSPGDRVGLLRQFVEQGGQLIIAAGGDFDPQAWNSAGWLDGQGILPAPLQPEPLGVLPQQAQQLEPFAISFESLGGHSYFQLAEVPESERRALYAQALFFKAVQVDLSADRQVQNDPSASSQATSPADSNSRWLRWSSPAASEDPQTHQRRRVLARFSDTHATPFLIERRVGSGKILFVTSGVQSDWNTLPRTNTILLFDRILRSMLHATLSARNFPTQERIDVPLSVNGQAGDLTLTRPDSLQVVEALDYGFIRRDQRGITIPRPFQRGVYRIAAPPDPSSTRPDAFDGVTEIAVNGSESESNLEPLQADELAQLETHSQLKWVGRGEQVNLAGAPILGQDSWWWIVLFTLLLLIAECSILAASSRNAIRVWPAPRATRTARISES